MALTVKVFPSDESGCGFYRMIAPAQVVAAGDADVDIQVVLDTEDERSLEIMTKGPLHRQNVIGVSDPECDVLVLQRPASRLLAEVIPHVQAYGTAVVCDYDDDFDTIHPRNPAWRAYEPHLSPESNKSWAKLASSLCDLVTVTTPGLVKRYGAHGRVVQLPNYVPENYLSVKPKSGLARDELVLGWAGNPQTHHGDLKVMGGAPAFIEQGHGAIFRAIGHESILEDCGFGSRAQRWLGDHDTGEESPHEVIDWVPIDEYPSVLASLDVGLAPLANSTFNHSKSWLKPLEMAALGVPFVATDTQQYRALGAGDLATSGTKSAWVRALEKLIGDEEYRRLLAEEGRLIARNYTYEKNGQKWLQAWADALAMRRAV